MAPFAKSTPIRGNEAAHALPDSQQAPSMVVQPFGLVEAEPTNTDTSACSAPAGDCRAVGSVADAPCDGVSHGNSVAAGKLHLSPVAASDDVISGEVVRVWGRIRPR